MANTSIYNAFERLWQHVVAIVGEKAELKHRHDIQDVDGMDQKLEPFALKEDVKNSDWAQNDAEQPDYIKNRTHYEEIETSNTLTVTYDYYKDLPYAYDYNDFKLVYPANFTADDLRNGFIVDSSNFGHEEATSFDDLWVRDEGYQVPDEITTRIATVDNVYAPAPGVYVKLNINASTTITIPGYTFETVIGLKQLDEKFIPDTIARVDTASVGQTVVVKEVDNNGKPIVWEATDLPSNEWKVIEERGTIGGDEAVTGHMGLSPTLKIDGTWTEAILEARWIATTAISSSHRLNCVSGDHIFFESAPITTTATARRYHFLCNNGFSSQTLDGGNNADMFTKQLFVNPGGASTGTALYAYFRAKDKAIGFYPHWWTCPAGTTVSWYGVIHYR